VKHAFGSEVVVLEIARLTPLKEIDAAVRRDKKYRQIAASIEHVGIIEPIVVFSAGRGKYLVLDGHKRLDILKARGVTEVGCLLATDDESYTYNKRVNYLSTIGEHHMILRNLENAVTEQEIAAALDVNVATIRAKRNLLDICSEAAETLKDKRLAMTLFPCCGR
jgi:ParB-like chromosome segregation protein Spo0J